ncbi:GNAT family N-acetyltransferase [Thalassovita sp.]|uniref:GNAT family N-acetyltransferase n=1 Tax=Thalassovita sp. TaxID=1979401 RepID=UPI0029DE5547|nr:GNAT family N-acyltransferase [Thalassovita sp.]
MPQYVVKIAESDEELRAAQHLRYEVFVAELGGGGSMVDHDSRLEKDRFDPFCDHLILLDADRAGDVADRIVGVYRLMRDDQARAAGQFYSQDEYDLTALKTCGRPLLELGRSCLHKDYRGGAAMFHIWNGISAYVTEHKVEILFGVASFHGTDIAALAQPLSLLHHRHRAPEALRVAVLPENGVAMNLLPPEEVDRKAAMLAMPSLIKAYLRLGGVVGDGAFVDHAFNTTDVCLIMDTAQLSEKQKSLYSREVTA